MRDAVCLNDDIGGLIIMSKLVRGLLAGAMSLGLTGCIAFGSIDRRADTINDQVANGQNQGVLLNLARASRSEPIYVVAFNQISASGTTDFHASAPTFVEGPTKVVNAAANGADRIATFVGGTTYLDNQTNTNFQMSLLGSNDFYSGLMAPITLQDVDLLLHQGYARELIFYLVIAKATITPMTDEVLGPDGKPKLDQDGNPVHNPVKLGPDGKPEMGSDGKPVYTMTPAGPPQVVFNDPATLVDEAQHPEKHIKFTTFEYYIQEAMEHGLTTETYLAPDETAGDSSNSGGGGGSGPKAPKLITHAELCYDRALVTAGDVADIDPNSFCGVKPTIRLNPGPSEPLYVKLNDLPPPLNGAPLEVEVTTRSIYGMFYYLGDIIGHNDEAYVHLHHYDNLPAETTVQEPLINVLAGQNLPFGPDGCFSKVSYEGGTFCAPESGDGADNTKRIIAILNALLALKQTNADIPSTQTVRIQQ